MAKSEKLSWLKWYPSDLEAEPTLKFCSWEAGFLWVKMLGLMHYSPQRGYLIKENGEPYTEEDLVMTIAGATPQRIRDCLFQLETHAVYSRDRRGIIYCRKMVKGEKRAKNLKDQKTKSRDKSKIKSSKIEDKSDLEHSVSDGDIKENSISGNQALVIPESRVQSPETREEYKQQQQVKPRGPDHQTSAVVAVGKQISKITGWDKDPNWFGDYSRIGAWLAEGFDPDLDIIPTVQRVMASRKGSPPKNLRYFEQAIADANAQRLQPVAKGNPDHAQRSFSDRPAPAGKPSRSERARAALSRGLDDDTDEETI